MNDSNKFNLSRAEQATAQFDDENNVEPQRRISERIALKHGIEPTHPLVDEIHHAIEDAYNLGVRRAVYHGAPPR